MQTTKHLLGYLLEQLLKNRETVDELARLAATRAKAEMQYRLRSLHPETDEANPAGETPVSETGAADDFVD